MAGSLGTRAFLFADLRGYTRFVESRGDAAASELLAAYRDLVRGVIGRHDGAEIRTEGDGVYVVFETVAGAVDAAVELAQAARLASESAPDLPIRVAIGIHAGETTAGDEGPVGSAVNIAARISATAEAGEILVSETVRALVRTARPYRFTALGPQRLKGVAEAIPVYRVETVAPSLRRRLGRQARARRRMLILAGVAVAAVLVVAGAAWAATRPPDCLTLAADTDDVVVRIDPERACAVQAVPVGNRPGSIVAAGDALWIAGRDGWTINRVDPLTGAVDGWLGIPGSPISMAAMPDGDMVVLAFDDRTSYASANRRHSVAFVSSETTRIDVITPLPPDLGPGDTFLENELTAYSMLAVAGSRPWVASPRGSLVRLDARGQKTFDLAAVDAVAPGIVATAAGTVWVADRGRPAVYRLDVTSEVPRSVGLVGEGGTRAMAAAPEALWLLRTDGSITRLDVTTGAQTSLVVEGSPTDLAIGEGRLWLIDEGERVVRSVDPTTGATLLVVETGGPPSDVADLGGSVWVTVASR